MNNITKKKLKATLFFPPYAGDMYALKSTGCGVYLIKKNGVIIYVGMSRKDVRNTMYRHFQQWTDRRAGWTKKNEPYERVTYFGQDRKKFAVKVIFCPTAVEAEILEQLLIKKFKPKDNELKLFLYSTTEYNSMAEKINNADNWNSKFDD